MNPKPLTTREEIELRQTAVKLAIQFFEGRAIADMGKTEQYLREVYTDIFNFISKQPFSRYEQQLQK